MPAKRKEKILHLEIKGSPVGTLYIAASKKGLLSLSMGRKSEKKFIEQISKRFLNLPIFIKVGSIRWAGDKKALKNLIKPEKLFSSKLSKTYPITQEEAKLPLRMIMDSSRQLSDYFSGHLRKFHLKKDFSGLTDFEKSVLKELEKIPCGKTSSYQEIAKKIGNPRACRAVGNAVGKNPFAVIVSCHRVIKSDGTIGGFSAPLSIKKNLLVHEKKLTAV
jgi:methylated-DNA-[protein]-cysteine S-methyltransferase